jgi:hypothetical protein
MQIISMMSVFTNLLYTFTYKDAGKPHTSSKLLNFFLLEHLVLVIFVILRYLLKNQAEWVKLFLERREYKLKQHERSEYKLNQHEKIE